MKKLLIILFCSALFIVEGCLSFDFPWDYESTYLCHFIIRNNSSQRIRITPGFHYDESRYWMDPGDTWDDYAKTATQYPSQLGISDTFLPAPLCDPFYIYDENGNILVQWSSKDSSDFDISIFNLQNWKLIYKPEPQEYYEEYPTPVWEFVITDEMLLKGDSL